jgi:hypothetical protein
MIDYYSPVYWKDPYTHCCIVGKSGEGKTALIKRLIRQDHLWRIANILIQPSDSVARECLGLCRGNAKYLSLETPISINPLHQPYHPSTISDLVAEAMNQVITVTTNGAIKEMTPKMRNILDGAIKYCLDHNRKSLLHVRDYIANLRGDGETRDGILSRLNFLLNDERMIPILCGNDSVKWGELIQNRETFLVDCFGMSKEKFVFTGTLVSSGIKNVMRHERREKPMPVSLYIDEAHLFVTPHLFDVLKEGRKHKISCIMATQDFASIDDRLARVMLNVGTLIAFRCGNREAQLLAKEMGTIKTEEVFNYKSGCFETMECDTVKVIQNLEKYHLAYMTPREKGIAKACRPLFARKIEPKRPEPKSTLKGGWFPLEPYRPESPPGNPVERSRDKREQSSFCS